MNRKKIFQLVIWGNLIMILLAGCGATDPWTTKADMPTGRWLFSTCVVDGKIYAIGGFGTPFQALGTVEVYDPATDTWTEKFPMPTARGYLSANVVNGKIYAIGGGESPISGYSLYETFSTVEEYDPATDTWTEKSPMPTPRSFHSAHVVDGKIYLIGGSHAEGPKKNFALTVEVYDPATDTWTQKSDMPAPHGDGYSSVVDGKIYAFGGWGGEKRVDEYDPSTDTWTQKSDMPTARRQLSTSALNGKIYLIGGIDAAVITDDPLATLEVYDPTVDSWRTASDMPTARLGPRTAVVNGKIYVIGGMKRWITPSIGTVEVYEPKKD